MNFESIQILIVCYDCPCLKSEKVFAGLANKPIIVTFLLVGQQYET